MSALSTLARFFGVRVDQVEDVIKSESAAALSRRGFLGAALLIPTARVFSFPKTPIDVFSSAQIVEAIAILRRHNIAPTSDGYYIFAPGGRLIDSTGRFLP